MGYRDPEGSRQGRGRLGGPGVWSPSSSPEVRGGAPQGRGTEGREDQLEAELPRPPGWLSVTLEGAGPPPGRAGPEAAQPPPGRRGWCPARLRPWPVCQALLLPRVPPQAQPQPSWENSAGGELRPPHSLSPARLPLPHGGRCWQTCVPKKELKSHQGQAWPSPHTMSLLARGQVTSGKPPWMRVPLPAKRTFPTTSEKAPLGRRLALSGGEEAPSSLRPQGTGSRAQGRGTAAASGAHVWQESQPWKDATCHVPRGQSTPGQPGDEGLSILPKPGLGLPSPQTGEGALWPGQGTSRNGLERVLFAHRAVSPEPQPARFSAPGGASAGGATLVIPHPGSTGGPLILGEPLTAPPRAPKTRTHFSTTPQPQGQPLPRHSSHRGLPGPAPALVSSGPSPHWPRRPRLPLQTPLGPGRPTAHLGANLAPPSQLRDGGMLHA